MLFDNIRDAIGHTPLVRLRIGEPAGVEVYAKLELQNLFAMKDRVARTMIMEARRVGQLPPGAPIVESSSGTMALGVALVGRSLGHDVHIVTDPRIDRTTLAKLRALGCQVHIVEAMSSHGWQSARIERLQELMADLPDAFWPQQYSNPDNPGAYRQLADELLADLDTVDVLVGSVGSGGSLCGSSRALRRRLPDLRVVGVDCVGSALFDQPDVPTRLQSGLGNSLLPNNLDRGLIDEVHWLNDREAFEATRDLAREQQIFGGNTAGSVYRVLRDVAARAAPGERIVGIFPDRGDRYADTVYSDEHWADHELAAMANEPAPRPVGYGATVHSWARADAAAARRDQAHLLFVESNTTGSGMLALRAAARMGLRAVLAVREPGRYPSAADTGCELLVCETNSLPALRAAVQRRFRREELAGVTTTSDFYVPMVAELTAWLGLPGNTVDATSTCRNKALLRARLARAGVPQPRYAVVTEPGQVAAAVAHVGLPCVVKPADESGSTDVLRCETLARARAHAEDILDVLVNARGLPTARTVLVEELVEGPEYSVEMFGADCVGITAKQVAGAPRFVETRHVFPATLPAEVAGTIVAVVRSALAATGMVRGPTHTELRLTASGPRVIELNPRLAGGMIPELIRLATGVDLLDQQLRAAVDQRPELTATRHRHAGIQFLTAPDTGTLRTVAGVERALEVPGVRQVLVTAEPGRQVGPPLDAYDRLGHVIACHDRAAEVEPILDRALAELSVEVAQRVAGGARR
ncbi:pyridoxal-phosphate dependent enzyme [Actinophytocola sediminis]